MFRMVSFSVGEVWIAKSGTGSLGREVGKY